MLNWQIQAFETLDSTQHYLNRSAQNYPEGQVIWASRQSAGQGREQRSWSSEPGGLYFSFLLRPENILPALPWGLWWAVLDALESFSGQRLTLKAPNDILWQGKKLSGTLIDSVISGAQPRHYVCGVGVNVNQKLFPETIKACSLVQLTGQTQDLSALLRGILSSFDDKYRWLLKAEFETRFLENMGERQVQIGYNEPTRQSLKEYWHGIF